MLYVFVAVYLNGLFEQFRTTRGKRREKKMSSGGKDYAKFLLPLKPDGQRAAHLASEATKLFERNKHAREAIKACLVPFLALVFEFVFDISPRLLLRRRVLVGVLFWLRRRRLPADGFARAALALSRSQLGRHENSRFDLLFFEHPQ